MFVFTRSIGKCKRIKEHPLNLQIHSLQMSKNGPAGKLSNISCCLCRSKKIKCDRQLPSCDFCRKADIICEYPLNNRGPSLARLKRRQKVGTSRFYGFNSVNQTLSRANKNFFNRDYELGKESTMKRTKLLSSTPLYQKYLENAQVLLSKIELVEQSVMSSIYANIVDFFSLKNVISSGQRLNYKHILLCYSLLLLSGRYGEDPFVEKRSDLLMEIEKEVQKAPDSTEKIASLMILMDYHYFLGNIETSWKLLFSATSISYALGLHEGTSGIWTFLIFYDSVICSTIGRPSSIHSINSENIRRLCGGYGEIALLMRQTNEIFPSARSKAKLGKILELDESYDILVKRLSGCEEVDISNGRKWETSLKILLLTSSRIKLLYPEHNNHSIIKRQLLEAFSHFINYYEKCLLNLISEEVKNKSKVFFFKTQFSVVQCCCFQAFLLCFCFLSRHSTSIIEDSSVIKKSEESTVISDPNEHQMIREISQLVAERETTFKNIFFGNYMVDIFKSIEWLLRKLVTYQQPVFSSIQIQNQEILGSMPALPSNGSWRDANSNEMAQETIPSNFEYAETENWVSECAQSDSIFFFSPDNFPPK